MPKSNYTRAKEISLKTKENVLKRQSNKSISGASLYNSNVEFHHVVFRSSSGVGYEWNIVALTSDEHRALHDKQDINVNGRVRYTWQEFEILIKNHLKIKYPNWSEDKCKYHKYWKEDDYEIECNY